MPAERMLKLKLIEKKLSSDHVYGALSPLIQVCRAFGFFPLNSELRATRPLRIYTLVFLSSHVYLWFFVIYHYHANYAVRYYDTQVSGFTNSLLSFSSVPSVLAFFVQITLRSKEFAEMLGELGSLEGGAPFTCYYSRLWAPLTLILILAQEVSEAIILDYDYIVTYLEYYLFTLPTVLTGLIVLQFAALLELLRSSLASVTCRMQACNAQLSLSLHGKLLETASKLQSWYSPILFTLLLNLFINYACYIYYIAVVTYYLSDSSYEAPFFLAYCVLHVVLQFSYFLCICSSCDETRLKAESFNDKLFIMLTDDAVLRENDQLRLYVNMNRSPKFTAGGFFTLNYSLVTSVVAVGMTYLVTLIQLMPVLLNPSSSHGNNSITNST